LVGVVIVVAAAGVARAYPEFQLSRDQTCSSCHLSPAGGGLLSENGLATAESNATWDVAPEAAHGALVGPSWLEVGAELRGAAGVVDDRGASPAGFPMQADGEAAAKSGALTLYATLGIQEGHDVPSFFASREHWAMWQSDAGSPNGLFVRAGRFMPVYGLRLADHTAYTRRDGQTPLYGEAYGVAVEDIQPRWEAHATGFVHDPLQYSAETGNGAALYVEARPVKAFSIGLEGRYAKGDPDERVAGGATAKLWIAAANLLLEGEVQGIRQTFAAGGQRDQVVSYLLASWFVHDGWMLDVGGGQFDEDTDVPHVDLEGVDVNVHWFATSHWELLLTNRIQMIALGSGGPTSGYSLVQFHYRL
jgi:hypothetical protein